MVKIPEGPRTKPLQPGVPVVEASGLKHVPITKHGGKPLEKEDLDNLFEALKDGFKGPLSVSTPVGPPSVPRGTFEHFKKELGNALEDFICKPMDTNAIIASVREKIAENLPVGVDPKSVEITVDPNDKNKLNIKIPQTVEHIDVKINPIEISVGDGKIEPEIDRRKEVADMIAELGVKK